MRKFILLATLLWLIAWPASAQVIGTQYVNTISVGGLCNAGACALFSSPAAVAVSFDVSGTYSGTLTFEGSLDGINWATITVSTIVDNSTATTTTGTGQYSVPNVGFVAVRLRATAWASGTARVSAVAARSTWAKSGGGGSTISGLVTTRLVTANGTTGINTPVDATYNSAYTGPNSDEPARPNFVFTPGLAINQTMTQTTASSDGAQINITYTPTGDASGNMRGLFTTVHATGSFKPSIVSGHDTYAAIDGTAGYLTVQGSTIVGTTSAASAGTGGIIGLFVGAVQQNAGATVPQVISVNVDPTNGGVRSMAGTISAGLYGVKVSGMTTVGVTAANRYGLFISSMAGTATTDDYGLYVDTTQGTLLRGPLTLGKPSTTSGSFTIAQAANGDSTTFNASDPGGNIVVKLPMQAGAIGTNYFCGATSGNAACANTATGGTARMIAGVATLAASSAVISSITPAFTSTATFACWGTNVTAIADLAKVVNTSSSSITITDTVGATDVINWGCYGY